MLLNRFVIVLFFTCSIGKSQTHKEDTTRLRVLTTLHIGESTYRVTDIVGYISNANSGMSYGFEGTAEYDISVRTRRMFVSLGLAIISSGGEYELNHGPTAGGVSPNPLPQKFEFALRTNYFSIPVYYGCSYPMGKNNNSFYFKLGGYFAFGVSGTINKAITKADGSYTEEPGTIVFDGVQEPFHFNKYDWGLGGGVGVNLFEKFRIGYLCTIGLAQMNANYDTHNSSIKGFNYLNFSFSYIFHH